MIVERRAKAEEERYAVIIVLSALRQSQKNADMHDTNIIVSVMKSQFKITPMADREQTFGVDLPRKAPLLVSTVYLLTWKYHVFLRRVQIRKPFWGASEFGSLPIYVVQKHGTESCRRQNPSIVHAKEFLVVQCSTTDIRSEVLDRDIYVYGVFSTFIFFPPTTEV